MALRFRKSISIIPGVRLNVGKTGISSLSVGKRGASVSVGRRGTYSNVGIPGTGISARTKVGGVTTSRASCNQSYSAGSSTKSKGVAMLLAFFLGLLGFHQFYLRNYWRGFLYLISCWMLIGGIFAIIDILLLAFMSREQFDAKYNVE
jgi:TM2 domain-containing membrane protein YozV